MRARSLTSLALCVVLTSVVGCSSIGGSDRAEESSTTTPSSSSTTTDTAAKPEDQELEFGALARILPTAVEIGEPYIEIAPEATDDGSNDPEPVDDLFSDACEALDEFDFISDDGGDQVVGLFSTADDREIKVRLDPTPDRLAEGDVDAIVAAFDDCGEVTVRGEDDTATPSTIAFAAERSDEFGDYGLTVTIDSTFEVFGVPLESRFSGTAFVSDGIGVYVSATSGFEQGEAGSAPTFVPADTDLIPPLAQLMEQRIIEL